MNRKSYVIGLIVTVFCCTAQAAEYPIGGVTPDRRPYGAPVITEVEHDAAWMRRALTGIEPPHPSSLKFLDDQGNWYTPFNRPGMTGRYDIRGWHTVQPKSQQ